MKTIILTIDEYKLLCKCTNFATYIFDSLINIHIDLAKNTAKYLALNLFLQELNPVSSDNGEIGFPVVDEYFETSADVIQLTISHMSWKKYRDVIQSLYKLKNKLKKEGN